MQKNYNLHSFAVLAYKQSPHIEECLLSLCSQTVKSRIFFFTSTPCDTLTRLCKKYDIPLIINPERQGIASDWTFAYNRCEGEYITLVHQDDIYLPQYTESCFSAIQKTGNTDLLILFTWYNDLIGAKERFFNINFIIKKILLLPFLMKSAISSHFLKKAVLSLGTPIPCPSVMYHKGHIGHFAFLKNFNCNMDWDAWLRLSEKKGSFVFVNKKLLLHRIYKKSQTSLQIENNSRRKEDLMLFQRIWPEPIARLLANLYSLSYKTNDVE